MTFVATIVGLGLAASAAGLPSKNRHTAKTDTGTLAGVVERNVLVFRGIPYAAPPVGPVALARLRPPYAGKACATQATTGLLKDLKNIGKVPTNLWYRPWYRGPMVK